VALAEGGILKRDFRKRNEEKCGDTSVLFPSSSRAEARTRVVGNAAVGFECGSAVARVDGGGGRFRNPSLSASLSADVGDAAAIAQIRKFG
jgi:hypothetical protein